MTTTARLCPTAPCLAAAVLSVLLLTTVMATTSTADPPPYSLGYDAARDPYADSHDALARAARSGRRVLIEVGGDWCVWCHVLDRIFTGHPEAHQLLRDHYVLLKVNTSDEAPNQAFLDALPRRVGYPQLFVARADGNIIHAQDPAAFLHQGDYDPERVVAFLQRWAGPEADAGP